jgi:hypothetical protein
MLEVSMEHIVQTVYRVTHTSDHIDKSRVVFVVFVVVVMFFAVLGRVCFVSSPDRMSFVQVHKCDAVKVAIKIRSESNEKCSIYRAYHKWFSDARPNAPCISQRPSQNGVHSELGKSILESQTHDLTYSSDIPEK